MLDTNARHFIQPIIKAAARFLLLLGVTPNAVTGAAFLAGLLAVMTYAGKFTLTALGLLWLSGLADTIDGTLARLSGRTSPLGTLFDFLSARVVEVFFIAVTALLFPESRLACVLLLASIIFSFSTFLTVGMLSEKMKKQEEQGGTEKNFYYRAGLVERTEMFLAFTLVILRPQYAAPLFYLLAAMIAFTGCRHFCEACKNLK